MQLENGGYDDFPVQFGWVFSLPLVDFSMGNASSNGGFSSQPLN